MDDEIQKLWLTIIAGLVLWIIKEYITYTIARSRIKAGLVSDINKHIFGISRQKEEANKITANFIQWGEHFPYPINYTVGRWAFYTAMQKDLPKYLKENELLMVMSIYQFMWEIDVCFEGLTKTINACERRGNKINTLLIEKLNEQNTNIQSRIQLLGNESIESLDKLKPIVDKINNN